MQLVLTFGSQKVRQLCFSATCPLKGILIPCDLQQHVHASIQSSTTCRVCPVAVLMLVQPGSTSLVNDQQILLRF